MWCCWKNDKPKTAMKRFIGSVLLLVIIGAYMISCEKDDICAEGTPTTPNMVVAFYNDENRGAYKPVANLKYFVEGQQDTISVGQVDSTALVPLRVDSPSVKWGFKYTHTSDTGQKLEDIDYIEFKYVTRDEYVSRACGFKTVFTLNSSLPGNVNPVLTGSTWLKDVQIENPEILNEDETHVRIYY